MKIAVIGAGISGILCAYRLSKDHQVTVFEKEDYAGGLCSKLNFSGESVDRYYHFFSKKDSALINLLTELNLGSALFWAKVKQADVIGGRLVEVDSPFNLVFASWLGMVEKIRIGLFLLRMRFGRALEFNQKIIELNKKNVYPKAFENYLRPLLEFKFEKIDDISASYLWARIREKKHNVIGYLKGGVEVLTNCLFKKIDDNGGKILFNTKVKSLKKLSNKKWQVNSESEYQYDYVISCISTQDTLSLYPELASHPKYKLHFSTVEYLNAGSFLLKIKKPLKCGYWLFMVELDDKSQQIIIDASAVSKNNIVYCPVYQRNEFFSEQDKKNIFKNCLEALRKINPKFDEDWIEDKIFCDDLKIEPVPTTEFIRGLYWGKGGFGGLYIPELTYQKDLLKTINTLAIKADIITESIRKNA